MDDRVARRGRRGRRRSLRGACSSACPSCSTIRSGSGTDWAEEDAHLAASEAAIASGAVHIEELEDLDLAIVTVPASWAPATGAPLHSRRVAGAAPDRAEQRDGPLPAPHRARRPATRCSTATRPGSSTCRAVRSAGSTSQPLAAELSAPRARRRAAGPSTASTRSHPSLHLTGAGADPTQRDPTRGAPRARRRHADHRGQRLGSLHLTPSTPGFGVSYGPLWGP